MSSQLKIPNTASFLLLDKRSTVTSIKLEPRSFIILREAVADGMKLPASPEEFEGRYRRDFFQAYLERDPSVYDHALQVFVATHSTCARFEPAVNQRLPTIGKHLTRVADSAISLLEVRLNALVQGQSEENSKSMFQDILKNVDALSSDASDLAAVCEANGKDVAEFKVQSKKNFEDASEVDTRWHKAGLSDEEWQKKLQNSTRYLEQMIETLQQESDNLDNQSRNAPSESSWEWKIFQPFRDTVGALTGVHLKSREEIQNSIERYRREAEGIRTEYNNVHRRLDEVTATIENLHHNMHDISTHAEEVAAAISSVYSAASRLITDNEDLARRLGDLERDLEMEAEFEESLGSVLNSQVDEISECYAMWEEVKRIGEIMRLMDACIAPLTKNPNVKEVTTGDKRKAGGGATAKGEDQRKGAEVEGRPMKCIGHARPDARVGPICETQLWSGDRGRGSQTEPAGAKSLSRPRKGKNKGSWLNAMC
ncbi:hypothetical protein FPCIR_11393 [Fusarium pseudocircinatum]|uniref:Uncharacterized protein n=1 Tax=Fusarium pseudocircinatum TaxID=56676 RepID=A0A8H5KQW0_9HYPO|nr:hypothetical protein FPCIR_11393 [Fusarium pseudocircinatum]